MKSFLQLSIFLWQGGRLYAVPFAYNSDAGRKKGSVKVSVFNEGKVPPPFSRSSPLFSREAPFLVFLSQARKLLRFGGSAVKGV